MRLTAAAILCSAFLALAFLGCAEAPPGPYVPKPLSSAIVYCNDNTGHLAGAKPWIEGGNCCCTPTEAMLATWQKDGACTGQTLDQVVQRYRDAGLRLNEPGHLRCNGVCPAGPHVVLGGKCLCPPTPGTEYYDRVMTGRGAVSRTPAPANAPTLK